MPIRANCPNCKAVLNIPDDVAGHVVQCTGCTTTFTAPSVSVAAMARPVMATPAAAPGTSRFGSRGEKRYDDLDDRPRSRRGRRDDDDSDLDDRPVRTRKARKKGESALPFVLAGGGLLLVVLVGLGIGVYYLFFNKSAPTAKGGAAPGQPAQVQGGNNNAPAPANGMPFTITAARKTAGRTPLDSGVEIEFTAHPGAGPMYTLVVQSGEESFIYHLTPFETTPGQHRLPLRLTSFGPRFGRLGGPMEVWIEERQIGAFGGGGGRIASNKLTVQ